MVGGYLAIAYHGMAHALNSEVNRLLRALEIEMHWNQLCFV